MKWLSTTKSYVLLIILIFVLLIFCKNPVPMFTIFKLKKKIQSKSHRLQSAVQWEFSILKSWNPLGLTVQMTVHYDIRYNIIHKIWGLLINLNSGKLSCLKMSVQVWFGPHRCLPLLQVSNRSHSKIATSRLDGVLVIPKIQSRLCDNAGHMLIEQFFTVRLSKRVYLI